MFRAIRIPRQSFMRQQKIGWTSSSMTRTAHRQRQLHQMMVRPLIVQAVDIILAQEDATTSFFDTAALGFVAEEEDDGV